MRLTLYTEHSKQLLNIMQNKVPQIFVGFLFLPATLVDFFSYSK